MSDYSLNQLVKLYSEMNANAVLAFLDQIVKSPEVVAEISQISSAEKKLIKDKERQIVTKSLSLEIESLIKKYKINDSAKLFEVIENISDLELNKLREKCLTNVINSIRNPRNDQ
jgi:hypothetical protein